MTFSCEALTGGTTSRPVFVVFTADPGTFHGGFGENYYLLEALQNKQNVTSYVADVCYDAFSGTLYDSSVLLVTTGEGPMTAQLCVYEIMSSCSGYVSDTVFFGTAGFSPRLGGFVNPPPGEDACAPPEEQGIFTRYGDLCITNHAVNWDCQSGEWSSLAAGYPNECSLPGDPSQPFTSASRDGQTLTVGTVTRSTCARSPNALTLSLSLTHSRYRQPESNTTATSIYLGTTRVQRPLRMSSTSRHRQCSP